MIHVQVSPSIEGRAELIRDGAYDWLLVVRDDQKLDDPDFISRLNELLRYAGMEVDFKRRHRMAQYNYPEAAGIVNKSVKWLQRRATRGIIPSCGDGHRRWFNGEQIDAINHALNRDRVEYLRQDRPDLF